MRRSVARLFLTALLGCLLVACTAENNAAIRQIPDITFANYNSLSLPVNKVDVIPPTDKLGDDTGFGVLPVPLDQVGTRYARQRFIAGGGEPNMTVVIADTRFSETPLRDGTTSGLDMLTMQRQQQVSIGMTIRLEVVDGTKRTVKQEFQLDRKITLNDNLSLADRDLKLVRFTEGFMADIDKLVITKLSDIFPNVTVQMLPRTGTSGI